MQKWEYLVMGVEWDKKKKRFFARQHGNNEYYEFPNILDGLGSQGWELITAHGLYEWHGGRHVHIRDQDFYYIFKRPISDSK